MWKTGRMQTDFFQGSFSYSVLSISVKEEKWPHLNLSSDLKLRNECAAASKGTVWFVISTKQDVTLITGATKTSI